VTAPSLPTIDQIRTLPAFTESEVSEDFIDENGHMNIGDYFRLGSWAVWTRLADLGMGPDYIERRGSSFFTVEHRIGYTGEMRLGQPFSVRASFVDRAEKTLHGAAYVLDEGRDEVACWLEAIYVHVSMQTRRASPIPEDLAQVIDEEIAARADWLAPAATGLTLRR
jgi:acyl-CoA thioester hydrolase